LRAIDEIGGPKVLQPLPVGWTFAGNTPFRRWKRETYRGGASDPFIVHWPARIKAQGAVRDQYAHIIDMVPTVLDLLDVEPPASIRGVAESPLHGVSFAHTFDDADAESSRHTQYFEMLGHRSVYHDGWRAVCPWPGPSFKEAGKGFGEPIPAATLTELDAHGWELYHVAEDLAETRDVAGENREQLIEMIGRWYVEAGKYEVMPVDGSGLLRAAVEKPMAAPPRDTYVLFPGTQSMPFSPPRACSTVRTASPPAPRSHRTVPRELLGRGTAAGGYSFFVKDKQLHYVHNYLGREMFHARLRRAVRVHRNTSPRDRGPERRSDHRRRSRAAPAHGTPIAPGRSPSTAVVRSGVPPDRDLGAHYFAGSGVGWTSDAR
jgi:hypothetical protein